MRAVTNTHLKTHGTTVTDVKLKFPKFLFEHPRKSKERSLKGQEAMRVALLKDPKKWKALGKRLGEFRRKLSTREKKEIANRARKTLMENTTQGERSAKSRRAALAAHEKHPELRHKRWRASSVFWKSTEGRKLRSKLSKKMWKEDPSYRRKVVSANRKHAISGRIPVRFSGTRPTEGEARVIAFAKRHDLPLTYVGDGNHRVVIPKGGRRHWRNPDFIIVGTDKVILVDAFWTKEQHAEMKDYASAGKVVLRVSISETNDEEWLLRKLRTFIES